MVWSGEHSPATMELKADQTVNVSLRLRTVMTDGRGTALSRSPAFATQILTSELVAGDIPDGSIGDGKLDRITDPIAILSADITSLAAGKITTGTLAADVAVLGTVQAGQIQTGSIASDVAILGTVLAQQIIGTTISAVAYSLISGTETMTIDSTDGFKQVSTGSDSNTITIHNGRIEVFDGTSVRTRFLPNSWKIGNSAFTDVYAELRKDNTEGGLLELKNNSDEFGVVVRADSTGGGRQFVYNGTSTTSLAKVGVEISGVDSDLGETNSGYISIRDSGGTSKRVELGVDGSGEGLIKSVGTTTADVQAVVSTNSAVIRGSSTAGNNGLYVNGNQTPGHPPPLSSSDRCS
jgi:hypothetical protein